jgi:hypothetical protein
VTPPTASPVVGSPLRQGETHGERDSVGCVEVCRVRWGPGRGAHLSVALAMVLTASQSTSVGSNHDVSGLSFLLLQLSLSASAPNLTALWCFARLHICA